MKRRQTPLLHLLLLPSRQTLSSPARKYDLVHHHQRRLPFTPTSSSLPRPDRSFTVEPDLQHSLLLGQPQASTEPSESLEFLRGEMRSARNGEVGDGGVLFDGDHRLIVPSVRDGGGGGVEVEELSGSEVAGWDCSS
ncbi:hypothetical protein BDY24DRAFT_30484 [Mrakia frigida]|uniref:uncharacterized protein n=1 Tax=Mrakia frigida TaxID=29902 RepID=UPI003FCC1F65